MPTLAMDADISEYGEHGRSTRFMKNTVSETSQESSRNGDNDNTVSDADDDDLVRRNTISFRNIQALMKSFFVFCCCSN